MEMLPIIKKNLSDNITSSLREYIYAMDISKSTKLPTENVISQNYGVSRITVRRALDELEQDGLILRIHGRGTFVNSQALQYKVNLNNAQEFSRLIRQCGYDMHMELTRFIKVNAELIIANSLGIAPCSPLLLVEKNYYADGHLAITCIDYLPADLFKEAPSKEEWENNSTFDILRSFAGILIARDRIEIQSLTIKEMEEITLQAGQFECSSVLALEGTTFNNENLPILYGRSFIDTKYIRYNLMRTQMVY